MINEFAYNLAMDQWGQINVSIGQREIVQAIDNSFQDSISEIEWISMDEFVDEEFSLDCFCEFLDSIVQHCSINDRRVKRALQFWSRGLRLNRETLFQQALAELSTIH